MSTPIEFGAAPGHQAGLIHKEGAMKRKPVLPPTCLYVAIVLMLALNFLFPLKRIIPFPWDLLGLIPLALGIALNIVADREFRDAKTTVKPFQESAALITNGVYRISRHPMYLGFVLILLGLAILLGSLTPFLVVPIFAIVMDRVFVVVEERMLEEKFGQAWLGYKSQTHRWV
jgi:protein-S-isoprenylcysteine O-methyltransferase Ste14